MKNSKILKIMILIITTALLVSISTNVWADDGILDFDNLPTGNETTDDGETPTVQPENTPQTPTVQPENTPQTPTMQPENTTTQDNTAGNNTSTYEESDIPHAGVEDTILMGAAFIVCGIIGIYTFMKLSAYSNI